MVKSGQKDEEYREIKPYWVKRLIRNRSEMESAVYDEFCLDLEYPLLHHNSIEELLKYFDCEFKNFEEVEFKNGYSKKPPQIIKKCLGIDICFGKPILGAPSCPVFRIKLGDEVSRLNC